MKPTYDRLTVIIESVCGEHLNEEYAELARQAAAALARNRPSPLLSGKPESWACGIVYALGQINFLSDKSQTPHIRLEDLCHLFGVSPATGAAKAKVVRDSLKMHHLDWHWMLPSRREENSMAWMISVNGLICDARSLPREIQEEAFRKGYIPYVPE